MGKCLTDGDWGKNKGKDVGKFRAVLVESLAGTEDSDGALKMNLRRSQARGLQRAGDAGPKIQEAVLIFRSGFRGHGGS